MGTINNFPIQTVESSLTGSEMNSAIDYSHALSEKRSVSDIDNAVEKSSAGYGLGYSPFAFLSKKRHKWDDATFQAAIASGSCTVTFVGTSLVVGTAQLEPMSTWVKTFQHHLSLLYPSVDFTFHNLGIGARSLANYVDPNFVGMASEPADKSTGYYIAPNTVHFNNGSVVGQSWEEAAEATTPDLLIIHHGMNDRGSSYDFALNLDTAISNSASWTKAPSITLVSEVLPHRENASAFYNDVREIGAITRNYAIAKGYGLIDTFRLWEAVTNDRDVSESKAIRQSTVANWEVEGTVDYLNSDSFGKLAGGNGSIRILGDNNIQGFSASFSWKPDQNSSTFSVVCNLPDDGSANDTAFWVARVNSIINIYARGATTPIKQFPISPVSAGVNEAYVIRMKNNRLEIYKDDVLVGSFINAYTKGYGGVRLTVRESEMLLLKVDLEKSVSVFGKEQLTDEQLLGSKDGASGWSSGDYSEGGNNINHPSRLGISEIFEPAILSFLESLD